MNPFRRAGAAIAARARFWAGGENRAAAILVLVGFVLTLAALLVARYIAIEVMAATTQTFDEDVLRRIHAAKEGLGRYRPAVDLFFNDVTALGGAPVLTLLTIFTAVYLALARLKGEAVLTLAVAIGATAINMLLKDFFDRPRPEVFARPEVYSTSFPSGHSMMSMAIYLTLGILLARLAPTWTARVFATGATIVISLLVAFSRLYQGVHYPTDVIAGALLGLAWALSILSAAEVFRRGRAQRQAAEGAASAAGAPAAAGLREPPP